MNRNFEGELNRIREEYLRRDMPGSVNIYTYLNPAFAFHMQEREWAVLKMLKKENIDLAQCDVLEVGCGTGHVLERFREFGAKSVTGVDLMEGRINEGKKNYPHVKLSSGNAAQLPFMEGQFHLVMQFMCLSSVLNSDLRHEVAHEMWRVLKPGGIILFYDMRPLPRMGRIFLRILAQLLEFLGRTKSRKVKEMEVDVRRTTPIVLFDLQDIRALFPDGKMQYYAASLDFRLAGLAGRSYLLAFMLSCLPFLRTHYLAAVQKANSK